MDSIKKEENNLKRFVSSKSDTPSVVIVLLTYNALEDTIECLSSLSKITYENYFVLLIDNGSTLDCKNKLEKYLLEESKNKNSFSVVTTFRGVKNGIINDNLLEEKIKQGIHQKEIVIISYDRNYGFAKGNNITAEFLAKNSNFDYYLLLNNDLVVDKEFLSQLINVGLTDSSIGVLGPKVYFYDYFGRKDVIDFAGAGIRFHWGVTPVRYGYLEVDRGQCDKIKQVDMVEGCCMLIRPEVVRKVGLFDPSFFMYWEETDFCTRASRAGFKLVFVPLAKIWHKIGFSERFFLPQRIYYLTKNRFKYVQKNCSKTFSLKFLLNYFTTIFLVGLAGHIIYSNRRQSLIAYLKGAWAGCLAILKG